MMVKKIALFQVIVTERANHAFDVMASTSNKDLKMYDGIVAVVSKRSLRFYFLTPRWINQVKLYYYGAITN